MPKTFGAATFNGRIWETEDKILLAKLIEQKRFGVAKGFLNDLYLMSDVESPIYREIMGMMFLFDLLYPDVKPYTSTKGQK